MLSISQPLFLQKTKLLYSYPKYLSGIGIWIWIWTVRILPSCIRSPWRVAMKGSSINSLKTASLSASLQNQPKDSSSRQTTLPDFLVRNKTSLVVWSEKIHSVKLQWNRTWQDWIDMPRGTVGLSKLVDLFSYATRHKIVISRDVLNYRVSVIVGHLTCRIRVSGNVAERRFYVWTFTVEFPQVVIWSCNWRHMSPLHNPKLKTADVVVVELTKVTYKAELNCNYQVKSVVSIIIGKKIVIVPSRILTGCIGLSHPVARFWACPVVPLSRWKP